LANEKQQLANENGSWLLKRSKVFRGILRLQHPMVQVRYQVPFDPIGVSAAKDWHSIIGIYIKNIEASGFSQNTVTDLNQMKASFDSAAAFHYRMSQGWDERLLGSLSPEKKEAEHYRRCAQKVDKALKLL